MTFKQIIERLRSVAVEIDRHELPDIDQLGITLNELCRAADEGRVVEVPLRGDGETIEVPSLATAKIPTADGR